MPTVALRLAAFLTRLGNGGKYRRRLSPTDCRATAAVLLVRIARISPRVWSTQGGKAVSVLLVWIASGFPRVWIAWRGEAARRTDSCQFS